MIDSNFTSDTEVFYGCATCSWYIALDTTDFEIHKLAVQRVMEHRLGHQQFAATASGSIPHKADGRLFSELDEFLQDQR